MSSFDMAAESLFTDVPRGFLGLPLLDSPEEGAEDPSSLCSDGAAAVEDADRLDLLRMSSKGLGNLGRVPVGEVALAPL